VQALFFILSNVYVLFCDNGKRSICVVLFLCFARRCYFKKKGVFISNSRKHVIAVPVLLCCSYTFSILCGKDKHKKAAEYKNINSLHNFYFNFLE
jgi:hypothetical protein